MHQDECDVFAVKLHSGKADIVFQTTRRTEILFHLISIFEQQKMEKFKIYVSKHISMKQYLDGPSANVGEFKKKQAIEQNDNDVLLPAQANSTNFKIPIGENQIEDNQIVDNKQDEQ